MFLSNGPNKIGQRSQDVKVTTFPLLIKQAYLESGYYSVYASRMAGRCFSVVALLFASVVWGAWLNYFAIALEGKETDM